MDSFKFFMYYRILVCGNFFNEEEFELGVFDLDGGEESFEGIFKFVVFVDFINYVNREGWIVVYIVVFKGFKNCLEILCRYGGFELERRDKCNWIVYDVVIDDCKYLLENLNVFKIFLRILVGEIELSNCGFDDLECENIICVLNICK